MIKQSTRLVMAFVVVLTMMMMAVSASAQVTELVFRQNDPPSEVKGLTRAVEEWNQTHPNIQVRFETVPWSDALNQFVREGRAGGGPDVLQIAFVWTRDLGSSGLLMNLDSVIDEDPPGKGIGDFLGTDLGIYEGSTYGIPWTVDTFVMAYRPDLFEEAGIDSFPDTWEGFFEAAKALTKDTDGDGRIDQYGFGFPAGSASGGGMWFLVNYYLWSHDKFIVAQSESGEWTVGVDAGDVAEAMAYYNRFFEEGVSPKSLIAVNSWGSPELTGGLARGDFAISFFPPATFRVAQDQADVPLATAMIPIGSVRRISHLGGRTLGINANTRHPEEAWQFLQYLVSRDVFGHYRQFPAQKSLLEELTFASGEEGYAKQLPHAITFKQYIDSPAPVSAMWDATNRQFAAVYSGQKTPQTAAQDLVEAIESILDENR